MADPASQLLRGTLHVLILQTLTHGQHHGYEIASTIERGSDGTFAIDDGALYQALHRMQERGWVESEWGRSEHGKRARFYRLTKDGRRRLRLETSSWMRYADAVAKVLKPVKG